MDPRSVSNPLLVWQDVRWPDWAYHYWIRPWQGCYNYVPYFRNKKSGLRCAHPGVWAHLRYVFAANGYSHVLSTLDIRDGQEYPMRPRKGPKDPPTQDTNCDQHDLKGPIGLGRSGSKAYAFQEGWRRP